MPAPTIQLQDTVFGHLGTPIVGPVNLTISPGDKLLLEGPSGCGKTSLLRGILGFLNQLQGSYQIDNEEISPPAIWHLRQQAGYISQELQLGTGSVRDWLKESLPPTRELHETELSRFQLTKAVLEQSLEDLSRGERQRLALVAMLAREPQLYLLDEVTSALNESLRKLVVSHIARTQATVLVVSHDAIWKECEAFRSYPLPVTS